MSVTWLAALDGSFCSCDVKVLVQNYTKTYTKNINITKSIPGWYQTEAFTDCHVQ